MQDIFSGCPIRVEIHSGKPDVGTNIKPQSIGGTTEIIQRGNGKVGGGGKQFSSFAAYKEYSSTTSHTDSGVTSPEGPTRFGPFNDFNGTPKPFGSQFKKEAYQSTITPERETEVLSSDMLKPSYFKERRFETLSDATNYQAEREQNSITARSYIMKNVKETDDPVLDEPRDSKTFPPPPQFAETERQTNEYVSSDMIIPPPPHVMNGSSSGFNRSEVMFDSLKSAKPKEYYHETYTSSAQFSVPPQQERTEKTIPQPDAKWDRFERAVKAQDKEVEPSPLYSIPKKDRVEEQSFTSASRFPDRGDRSESTRFEERSYEKERYPPSSKFSGDVSSKYSGLQQDRDRDRFGESSKKYQESMETRENRYWGEPADKVKEPISKYMESRETSGLRERHFGEESFYETADLNKSRNADRETEHVDSSVNRFGGQTVARYGGPEPENLGEKVIEGPIGGSSSKNQASSRYGGETVARYGVPEPQDNMILEDRSFEVTSPVKAEAVRQEKSDDDRFDLKKVKASGPAVDFDTLPAVPTGKKTYFELKPLSVPRKKLEVQVFGEPGLSLFRIFLFKIFSFLCRLRLAL